MKNWCSNCDPQFGKVIRTKGGKCVDCGRPINPNLTQLVAKPTHMDSVGTACYCVEETSADGKCVDCGEKVHVGEGHNVSKTCKIIVNTSFDGTHNWPTAPNFLKNEHHHLFHVTVEIVTKPGDNDRTLEFFAVRHELNHAIGYLFSHGEEKGDYLGIFDCKDYSCEKMSDMIYDQLLDQISGIQGKEVVIRIMEDNYGGSETKYSGIFQSIVTKQ